MRLELWGCIQDLLLVFPEVSSQVSSCKDAPSEKVASSTMAGVGMGMGIGVCVGGCWEGKMELVNSKSALFATSDLTMPQSACLLPSLGHMSLERPGCSQMSLVEKLTFKL